MIELSTEDLEKLDAMKLPCALKLRKSFGIGKGCSVKTLFLVARNNSTQNQERFIENCKLRKKIEQLSKLLKMHHDIAKVDIETYIKLEDGTFVPLNAAEGYAESGRWEEVEAALEKSENVL